MTDPPSGTVTFLFTDIEGSTRRWQDEPEAMRTLLVDHDAILREVIDKHRGHLFKHTGDGIVAAFESASDAVSAAVDAQARLREMLPVRMGLHTGEAELRDGDYFGSTLNRCARLMGIAHGGQIVCGEVTAGLVRGREDLQDLGEHRLRDLSRAERVWQVGGGEFAALRSLDVAKTNLPLQLSSFVGREPDMAEISTAVIESRLVTLTGVGGVGKTRLALQVAADMLPRFADGAWVCELAAASNEEDMAQVVALALGVVQRQQMTLSASIVDLLRTRVALVVLDNCEHLLDPAAELINMVLAGAPGVRILATSREGFGIPGERVQPLRSLSVSTEHPESSDAVLLFAERARAVAPGFVLDEEYTSAVIELCRRLDGIPLAIELAAARVAVMTPQDIVAHLDERFRLLTGGRRGRVGRHQTLGAAIEWSYSLLNDIERRVFDRLGVFPASFDEAAATSVCSDAAIERWDVIDTLASLVAKSMLAAERKGNAVRYQLLETLRHFARDHAGDLDALRRRHAAHYAAFAEQAAVGLMSRDELIWRPRLGLEIDNLRTAVGWALDSESLDEVAIGVRIIDALISEATIEPSWGIQAWAAPALSHLDQLLAEQRSSLHAAASYDAFYQGDYMQSRALGRLCLAESITFTPAYFAALCFVGSTEIALGQRDAAMAVLADGRRLLLSDGGREDWRTSALHAITASIAAMVGDNDLARAEAHDGLAVARRLRIPTQLANALATQGHIDCIDNPQRALASVDEAIELFEAGAADAMYPLSLIDRAVLRTNSGDVVGAARAARDAVNRLARDSNQTNSADAVAVAALVLSRDSEGLTSAAVLDGACHGPLLGQIHPIFAAIHQTPLGAAREQVARSLGPVSYAKAIQYGAAMTYDEIIAFTLEQLARIGERE